MSGTGQPRRPFDMGGTTVTRVSQTVPPGPVVRFGLPAAACAMKAAAVEQGKAELLTGIEGASSRPVRRIVLITNSMLEAAPYRER